MIKPKAKFRAGPVSCAIWGNQAMVGGRKTVMLKASVERRFKDATGTWKFSNSFSRNEIPLAIYCLERAFDKIIAEEQSAGEEVVE